MAAMILAAGLGERLRPITDTTPKALVEVGGISMLSQHLQRLADARVERVVINLGWLGEQIAEQIGSGQKFGLQVIYSPEYDNILDTGGGIKRALPLIGNVPFWVINADIYTDIALPNVKLAADSLAHLVLVPTPAHKESGDFELRDGKVRNSDSQDLTYSGIAFYRPEFFADAGGGRFSVVPLWREAADRGQLDGSLYEGTWEDVGTPERLAALNRKS
ncbi:Nucleotidyl transferase [uncultured Woeseiaceae bacterium]|uniref:Nucleotidyl transferase n=1 Tax=uncultured Woeseiaceae bacterium TaxID=1983305 RepID=A0A7D9D2W2_9GAMM|nr:Nucleotidyl transferase [uncultured Woeseiaceae bacterium]